MWYISNAERETHNSTLEGCENAFMFYQKNVYYYDRSGFLFREDRTGITVYPRNLSGFLCEEYKMIYRTKKNADNPYVITNKYALDDTRLSLKAKGLMWWFLSKPDDWKVYESVIVKSSADGRDSVRSCLKELEKYGYISRYQERESTGQFSAPEMHIYEEPVGHLTLENKEKGVQSQ